jgi:hypothetical protein
MMGLYFGDEKVGEARIVTSHETIPPYGAPAQAVREIADVARRHTVSFSTIYIDPQINAVLRALQHDMERQAARWPPRRDRRGNIRKRRPDRRRRFRSKEVSWRKKKG